MRFIDQKVFEDGKGDCLSACVATVLGMYGEEVPNFAEMDFFEGMEKWLDERGFKTIHIRLMRADTLATIWFGFDEEPVILYGSSPRFNSKGTRKGHAVVGQTDGYGVKMIHDPHPSREGLYQSPFGIIWIVKK